MNPSQKHRLSVIRDLVDVLVRRDKLPTHLRSSVRETVEPWLAHELAQLGAPPAPVVVAPSPADPDDQATLDANNTASADAVTP